MGDMGDMDCCKELFAKIKKQFGGIDVLVNNAGVSYIGLLQDMSSEDWDKILHMNLTSVLTAANWRSLIWYTKTGKDHQYFLCMGCCRSFL